jgi:hypothetical protein
LVLGIVMKNRGAEFRVINRFHFFHSAAGDGRFWCTKASAEAGVATVTRWC